MTYLTFVAARHMFEVVKLGHVCGITAWTETMDRLIALRQMCSAHNPSGQAAARILKLEEWRENGEWLVTGNLESQDSLADETPSLLRPMHFPRGLDEEEDEPQNLCFVAAGKVGLSDWEFHQYDADHHPSVPHGHWQGKSRPKLDPYQGWVYEGTRQTGRVPKRKIIGLWNDQKFRDFSLAAIHYYLDHHPQYGGWRVARPLRLPRRR